MHTFQNKRKRIPVILCAAALGLGLTQSAQAAGALPKEQWSDPAHWSSRASVPEAALVSRNELDVLNQASRNTRGTGLRDLTAWTETEFDGEARADALQEEAMDKATRIYEDCGGHYDSEGNEYDDWYESVEQFFSPMIENSYDTEAMGVQYECFALCTTPTSLRNFPSEESIYDNGNAAGTDYQIRSTVELGEPLVLKGESQDGKYAYAFSDCDSGWVRKTDLAVCRDRESWLEAWHFPEEESLVVYGDGVRTTPLDEASEGRSLHMGTVLRLALGAEYEEQFTFDSARGDYLVWYPQRDEEGWYQPELAVVDRTDSVSQGYLPLSSTNLASVALKRPHQVQRGGAEEFSDCTGYVRRVYRCFGLELSRTLSGQKRQPVRQWNLKSLSKEKKTALLKKLPVGALLTLDDQELMYLGHEGDEFYVIHAVSAGEQSTDERHATAVSTLDGLGKGTLNRLNLALVPWYKAQADDISAAKVTLKAAEYTGEAVKAKPVVSVGDVTLKQGVHYTLSYSNNVKVGKAAVTIQGVGNWKGRMKRSFTIRPASTRLTELQQGEGSLTLRWKRQKNVKGYQIQYSSREDFSGAKSVTVKGRKKSAKTIRGLEEQQLCFVRIRTWKNRGGRRYYSSWSEPKSERVL